MKLFCAYLTRPLLLLSTPLCVSSCGLVERDSALFGAESWLFADEVGYQEAQVIPDMRIPAELDSYTIEAKKRTVKKINYGFVGDITKINKGLLMLLLHNEYIPVICSLSHDKQGQILNTNADTIAASIAVELSSKYNVSLYCLLYTSPSPRDS